MKELKVTAIKDGTVIDHIPASSTFKVVSILNLEQHPEVVMLATNLHSKKLEKKGLIKVGGKIITSKEANAIAIIAPQATVNIIKDYKVVQKIFLSAPDELENLITCSNPECISNNYEMKTLFKVISKKPLVVRCNYCERVMQDGEILIKS